MVYAFEINETIFPPARFGNLGNLVTDIITILVAIGGFLSIIFIIYGGIQIITASGDEKKLASARAVITYAVVGLVVITLVFIILQVVQYFLSSNVQIT